MRTNLFKSIEERNEWILLYALFMLEYVSIHADSLVFLEKIKVSSLLEGMELAENKLKYYEKIQKLPISINDFKSKEYIYITEQLKSQMWDELSNHIADISLSINKYKLLNGSIEITI